jgi:rubrerythrin
MDVNDLNSCIRSELAAVETYRQALEKARDRHGRDPDYRTLEGFCREHEESSSRLRALVVGLGGEPTDDSGAWGTWSKTVMGAAKVFGDASTLKALKEGEETGLKEYRALADDADAPPQVKTLASELAQRRAAHVDALDRMIAAA